MVRSLGIVMLVVVAVWFLAQPPHSAEKKIRVVDPASDVQAFSAAAPGGAVPRTMPPGWQVTVSDYDSVAQVLRVGWVTPAGHYAEYAATPHPTQRFLGDITGEAPESDPVDIAGNTWKQYRKDKAISLVHLYGTTTVVLGTLRDTATLDELRVLAGRLAA